MASTTTGVQNTRCGHYTSQKSLNWKTNQELTKNKELQLQEALTVVMDEKDSVKAFGLREYREYYYTD